MQKSQMQSIRLQPGKTNGKTASERLAAANLLVPRYSDSLAREVY
jgi:hypothetical protein